MEDQQNFEIEPTVQLNPEAKDSKYRELFNKYDANQDGKIDLQELKTLIQNCGHHDFPNHIVHEIFKRSDSDNNRYLNYQEFVEMMNDPLLKPVFQKVLNRYINTLIPGSRLGSRRRRRRPSRGIYEDEYKIYPPPIWMILISILQLILYSVDTSYVPAGNVEGPISNCTVYDPEKREQIWRYFTYIFVHTGPLHLIVNVLVQIVLGIPLEMVHNGWRVMITYFSGVLSGSLASSITEPHFKLAGASGGVYAIITAHIASLIINWKEVQFGKVQLVIFTSVIVSDFGYSIYSHGSNMKISYVAHLAGAVAGLLVGIFALRNLEVSKAERKLSWIAFVVFSTFIITAIIWNVAFPNYFTNE